MATGVVKLLFDENVSHRQVEFVAKESRLGQMQHIRALNWSGKPDHEWIPLAVRQSFVIVTGDRNEKTRGYTVADQKTMNAQVLLFASFWDHLGRWEKAKWLVKRIEAIIVHADNLQSGSVALIDRYARAQPI